MRNPVVGPRLPAAADQRLCGAPSATAMAAATRKTSRGSGTVTSYRSTGDSSEKKTTSSSSFTRFYSAKAGSAPSVPSGCTARISYRFTITITVTRWATVNLGHHHRGRLLRGGGHAHEVLLMGRVDQGPCGAGAGMAAEAVDTTPPDVPAVVIRSTPRVVTLLG
jgi:hypothetical protein